MRVIGNFRPLERLCIYINRNMNRWWNQNVLWHDTASSQYNLMEYAAQRY